MRSPQPWARRRCRCPRRRPRRPRPARRSCRARRRRLSPRRRPLSRAACRAWRRSSPRPRTRRAPTSTRAGRETPPPLSRGLPSARRLSGLPRIWPHPRAWPSCARACPCRPDRHARNGREALSTSPRPYHRPRPSCPPRRRAHLPRKTPGPSWSSRLRLACPHRPALLPVPAPSRPSRSTRQARPQQTPLQASCARAFRASRIFRAFRKDAPPPTTCDVAASPPRLSPLYAVSPVVCSRVCAPSPCANSSCAPFVCICAAFDAACSARCADTPPRRDAFWLMMWLYALFRAAPCGLSPRARAVRALWKADARRAIFDAVETTPATAAQAARVFTEYSAQPPCPRPTFSEKFQRRPLECVV